MKKIILVLLIVAVIGTGGFLTYKYLIAGGSDKPVRYEQFDMGEFLVNLKGDHRHYLRTQIIVEYVYDKDTEELFSQQQAKSRDKVISVLRSKTSAELLEVENLTAVRDQLKSELEVALGLEETIVDLWFVNFIIQ